MQENNNISWQKYFVTIVLLIINIFAYILCSQMGEVVYNIGSMNAENVFGEHEFYRLITAIFLHGDIEHIVSNMIFLVGLGQMIECAIGHLRFFILYMFSGLGASLVSMIHSVAVGEIYNSVGASGAIFGLIGALFVLVVIHNGRFGQVSIRRLLFAVVYMIYSGARTVYVDNAAHVGGLICGIFIMALMNLIEVHRNKKHMGGYLD